MCHYTTQGVHSKARPLLLAQLKLDSLENSIVLLLPLNKEFVYLMYCNVGGIDGSVEYAFHESFGG